MLIGIVVITLVSLSVFIAWYTWFTIATRRKLKQHQAKWDAIKAKCSDYLQIETAYLNYIESLEPDPMIGRCFPRQ